MGEETGPKLTCQGYVSSTQLTGNFISSFKCSLLSNLIPCVGEEEVFSPFKVVLAGLN